MGSGCLQAAPIQNDDVVRLDHGAHVMGNQDDGAALQGLPHSPEDGGVALVVQTGAGLVHQQIAWLGQQSSGDGNALTLAAGEQLAGLSHLGVEALRKLPDEAQSVCQLRGGGDLFFGGLRGSVTDIITNCAGKQRVVLQNIPELPPQQVGLQALQLHAAQADGTAVGGIDALQKLHQGGFAAAVVADDGGNLALGNGEAEILQHRRARLIAETDVVQNQIPAARILGQGKACVQLLQGLLQQLSHILQGALGVPENLIVGQDLGGVLVDLVHIGAEFVDAAVGHLLLPDHAGAENRNEHGAEAAVEGEGGGLHHAHKGLEDVRLEAFVDLGQALPLLPVLQGLGFHVLGGGNMFGEEFRHLPQAVILPPGHRVLGPAHNGKHQNAQGDQHQHPAGQRRAVLKQHNHCPDQGIERGDQAEDHGQHLAGGLHVVDHTGDQGGGLPPVHLGLRQAKDLVPEHFSGLICDPQGGGFTENILDRRNDAVAHGQQNVAQDHGVVELALVEGHQGFGRQQGQLRVSQSRCKRDGVHPPGDGKAGVELHQLLQREAVAFFLHISPPPSRSAPSFPSSRDCLPAWYPGRRRPLPFRPAGR